MTDRGGPLLIACALGIERLALRDGSSRGAAGQH
ncbi:MAG: 1-hydroxy-2-methyl-2-butenyl 4-diphosphate reductase, partial [Streptomyces sp.]